MSENRLSTHHGVLRTDHVQVNFLAMTAAELRDVIATRKLYRLDDPGADIITSPVSRNRHRDMTISFAPTQIVGIGNEYVDSTYGIDAVQALQLAMKRVGAILDRLNAEAGDALRWEGDESGSYGLPSI